MLQMLSGPEFPPGRIVITANAAQRLSADDITSALRRHLRNDWGGLGAKDEREEERSLLDGCRLLSAYHSATGVRFRVISEADRSITLLLPEDY